MNELADKVAARSLDVEVKSYLCFGGCEEGPNVVIHPQKTWYAGVKMEDLPEILDSLSGRTDCIPARYYRSRFERDNICAAGHGCILIVAILAPALTSIHVKAIQFGDVLTQDFPLVFFTDALEVLGDFFARVGPEGCAVGKVRRPEQIIHTNLAPMSHSKRIVDKGSV